MNELIRLLNLFEEELIKKDTEGTEPKKHKKNLQNVYLYKIRDYFIKYINDVIQSSTYKDRVPLFFENVFNRQHIVDAAVFYVETNMPKGVEPNSYDRSESSVDEFIIAFNQFYELILSKEYKNPTIKSLTPFAKNLREEIVERVEQDDFVFIGKKSYPAIQEKEYNYIINYISESKHLSSKDKQVGIIFKLFLLLGISVEKISGLKKSYFNPEKRTLTIPLENADVANIHSISVELPYALAKEISNTLIENSLNSTEFLFATSEGNPIQSSYFSYLLKGIMKKYEHDTLCDKLVLKRFTSYGMAKYAICQMLGVSMMLPVIVQLTGRTMEFIESCRMESTREPEKRNHYINYKIRSTNTYFDLQN
ncbi:hypothetical protein SDC9_113320 [bioreactor metagenome]|uniref:Tyr recombinase domain-containing protein n=1 Tax=bioreactor metagenome TaxID=1076179 RepID=A0A645BT48_9ZZZZ